ncbi:MAG: glycoside hydrolase family 16 protein [Treponema sp.]
MKNKSLNLQKLSPLMAALLIATVPFFICSCGDSDTTNGLTEEQLTFLTNDANPAEGIIPTADRPAATEITTPTPATNMTLAWHDEFEESSLNTDYWTAEIAVPGANNNEVQSYVDSTDNYILSDGTLKIKAIPDGSGGWTSARLNTKGKINFSTGYFEAKVKISDGTGVWPAFWMVGNDNSYWTSDDEISAGNTGGWWPNCGEIDVYEYCKNYSWGNVGSQGSALHRHAGTGVYGSGTERNTTAFNDGKFHTFGTLVTEDKIEFYWDGKIQNVIYKYYASSSDCSANAKTGTGYVLADIPFKDKFKKKWMYWPYNDQKFIILNLAMGGVMGGDIKCTTTQTFEVDYVRVWQTEPTE